MNKIFILHQEILIDVQEYVVDEHRDECIDCSDRVRWLLLLDVVRVWAVHRQTLEQLDIVDATYQSIFALANATAEPEHAHQSIDGC